MSPRMSFWFSVALWTLLMMWFGYRAGAKTDHENGLVMMVLFGVFGGLVGAAIGRGLARRKR